MKKLLVTGALVLSLILPPYSLGSSKEEPKQKQQLETIIKDGMYDDHNAFVDESKYSLEKILESVELIGCEAGYTITFTDQEGKVTKQNTVLRSIGSGIVIEKKDGKAYVITNNHVTNMDLPYETSEGITVTQDYLNIYILKKGSLFINSIKAEKVASDPQLDVALLEVKDSSDFKKFPYKIGNSDDLRPGDFVWVAGNPLGLVDYVLKGNVSKTEYPEDARYFMIGCNVEPGYSGGAVIAIRDGEYELVGLVVATLVRQDNPINLDVIGGYGIAIKINDALKVVNNYFKDKGSKK
jgi:serine protease Do